MRRARPCEYCGQAFRPPRATSRFCSRACRDDGHRRSPAPSPVARRSFAYNGRLSDALWREIHAARAEAATAPLFRPGNVG
jgi:hypothetical protein